MCRRLPSFAPLLTCLLIALASPAGAAAAAPAPAAAPSAADAFARLKQIEGRWKAATPDVPGGLVVAWKVTAGGSAVMETLFEGTPHEMVSVYFLDGDELRLTHYCAAGNQPRMRYDARQSSADEIVFEFDGGTSFNPRRDFHIHEGRISFAGGAVTETWAGWSEGKQSDVKRFTLGEKI